MNQSKKNSKAVVFGGSGFVGSHVADALTKAGYEVRIFDMTQSPYLRADQEMILGNILNPEQVQKAVEGCDYVYNFAGIADLDDATTKPLDTIQLNIVGNTHIMNAAVQAKVKRFVYASTIYVYSERGGFYRCSKQASELYIEEYQRRYNLDFTVLRFSTLYGPRANEKNSIYNYLKQAFTKGSIDCKGSGDEVRDYVHVRDAARLSVDILGDAYRNQHVIISGHQSVKFKDMVLLIKEILNKDLQISFAKKHDSAHYDYTPYSFNPKIGYKIVNHMYLDIGQGLLECLHEIHEQSLQMQERESK
jgi:UDP-glucose 4-epimerase